MIKFEDVKLVTVQDWDNLVKETYKKPYSFQQQEGCQPRGVFRMNIPYDIQYAEDEELEMNDEIPEEINGDIMGVKFEKWLERDPNEPVGSNGGYHISLFWARNFYPNIYTLANDLYKKGLIGDGNYLINIDW